MGIITLATFLALIPIGLCRQIGPAAQRRHRRLTYAAGAAAVDGSHAILACPYRSGASTIDDVGSKVVDLPAGPINHHWTKNVLASRDGTRLYVTVGSNSNIGENGIEAESHRAAILEVELATHRVRVFASGLRNPNGLAWYDGALWTVVNERDELGNDLVPDYLTAVIEGGFYGWPYSYLGQHVDERGEARGRPVGLTFDLSDALLVADDVGNCVWRAMQTSTK